MLVGVPIAPAVVALVPRDPLSVAPAFDPPRGAPGPLAGARCAPLGPLRAGAPGFVPLPAGAHAALRPLVGTAEIGAASPRGIAKGLDAIDPRSALGDSPGAPQPVDDPPGAIEGEVADGVALPVGPPTWVGAVLGIAISCGAIASETPNKLGAPGIQPKICGAASCPAGRPGDAGADIP